MEDSHRGQLLTLGRRQRELSKDSDRMDSRSTWTLLVDEKSQIREAQEHHSWVDVVIKVSAHKHIISQGQMRGEARPTVALWRLCHAAGTRTDFGVCTS